MIIRLVPLLLPIIYVAAQNTTIMVNDANLVWWSAGTAYSTQWPGPSNVSFYAEAQCGGTAGTSLLWDAVSLNFTGVSATVLAYSDTVGSTATLYVNGSKVGQMNTNVPGAYYANCAQMTWGSTGTLPLGMHNFTVQKDENTGWLYLHAFTYSASLAPTTTSLTSSSISSTASASATTSASADSNGAPSSTVEIAASVSAVAALAIILILAFLLFRKRNRNTRYGRLEGRYDDPGSPTSSRASGDLLPLVSTTGSVPPTANTIEPWSPPPVPITTASGPPTPASAPPPPTSISLGMTPIQRDVKVAVQNLLTTGRQTDEPHHESPPHTTVTELPPSPRSASLTEPAAPPPPPPAPPQPPRAESEPHRGEAPIPAAAPMSPPSRPSSPRHGVPELDLIRELVDRNVPEPELSAVIRLVTGSNEYHSGPPPSYEQGR